MMKMNYLPNRRNDFKKKFYLSLAFLIFGVSAYFWWSPVFWLVSVFSTNTLHFFAGVSSYAGGAWNGFFNLYRDKGALVSDNEALSGEIEILNQKLLNYKSLEDENIALKKLMGRGEINWAYATATLSNLYASEKFARTIILSAVLSGPEVPPYDSLILDAGFSYGISNGKLVVAEPNIALGRIYEVYGNRSKTRLFSSYGLKTSVFLGKNMVEIFGTGGGNFYMSAPKDFKVSVGDMAVVPGVNRRILAVVKSIDDNPKDSFKFVFLNTPANVRELRFVGVLRSE